MFAGFSVLPASAFAFATAIGVEFPLWVRREIRQWQDGDRTDHRPLQHLRLAQKTGRRGRQPMSGDPLRPTLWRLS